MQPGSIVERTKEVTSEDIEVCSYHRIPIPPKEMPFVIEKGPYRAPEDGKEYVMIVLEEYPSFAYNSDYFSELLPPEEVSIEEIISESEMA